MILKDVAIIGAGASGSSAAFHLSKEGRSVVVLEKKNQSFSKPCGGGMASSVQSLFPFDLTTTIEEVIKKVEFTWRSGDKVTAKLPGKAPFWIINRSNLDNLIINESINLGAELIKGFNVIDIKKNANHWQIISNEGLTISAKAIVIADGSNSPWPKLFGLGPKKIHKAKTISLTTADKGNLENGTSRFEFGLVKYGFAWAFPTKKGLNIGLGTFIGNEKQDTEEILKRFLESLELKSENTRRKEKQLNVWNGHYRLDGEGIVIIGDAASLCDPFLAEGIRPALISGYEAARCLNNWLLNSTNDLRDYSKAIKKEWGNSMAWGQKIAQIFYRLPRLGYQLGIKRPTAPRRIAQILSGELSYGDIAQRSIRRLLLGRK